jgi:hypothetical protein
MVETLIKFTGPTIVQKIADILAMLKMKKYLEQFTSNRIPLSCVNLQLLSIGRISYY